jgi:hypothetical protein
MGRDGCDRGACGVSWSGRLVRPNLVGRLRTCSRGQIEVGGGSLSTWTCVLTNVGRSSVREELCGLRVGLALIIAMEARVVRNTHLASRVLPAHPMTAYTSISKKGWSSSSTLTVMRSVCRDAASRASRIAALRAFRRWGMVRLSEQLNQIVKGPAASKRDSMMVFDDRGIGDASRVASRRPQDSTVGGHQLPP